MTQEEEELAAAELRERRESRKAFFKLWGQVVILAGVALEGGFALWKARQGADAGAVKEAVQINFDHAEAAYTQALQSGESIKLLRADLGALRSEVNEVRNQFMAIILQLAKSQPQFSQVSEPALPRPPAAGFGSGAGRGGGHRPVAGHGLPRPGPVSEARPALNPAAQELQQKLDALAEIQRPEPELAAPAPPPPPPEPPTKDVKKKFNDALDNL